MQAREKIWARRSRDDLTCEQALSLLFDYLDRQLEPSRQRDFERHLVACPSCLSYLKTYRETIHLGRLVLSSGATGPASLASELRRAILVPRQSCA